MSYIEDLKEKCEQWKNIGTKNINSTQEADDFYEKEVFPLVIENFIEKNSEISRNNEIDYLILSVGTSYEPLVLSIKLFNPKKILFLYTLSTELMLNKIVDTCKLCASSFDKADVNDKNPSKMYRAIKKFYKRWGYPENVGIDFTGGTKAMSATAAMAGAIIDAKLVYVGNTKYLKELRRPEPGTEVLTIIESPYKLFGDLEVSKAMNLFSYYNYSGAREKLDELVERVNDDEVVAELKLLYLLSLTYEKWDNLEFNDALTAITDLINGISGRESVISATVMVDFLPKLKKQKQILEVLKEMSGKKPEEILNTKNYIIPLTFSMFINAQNREKQNKYDLSALLLYRLLETIEQRRLMTHGIYVSNPDYDNIDLSGCIDTEQVQTYETDKRKYYNDRVNDISIKIFGEGEYRNLPDKIALLEGFFQLCVLKDKIFSDSKGNIQSEDKIINQLKRIRSTSEARNNSILAHGLTSISNKNFETFKRTVEDYFKKFCEVEGINFEEYLNDFVWLNPENSKYYNWKKN